MEKTNQTRTEVKGEKVHRVEQPAIGLQGMQDEIWIPPAGLPLRNYTPQQFLHLQRQVGNQAIQQRLQGELAVVMRDQARFRTIPGASTIDPEVASGRLPFTEEGWDGRAIGKRLSQLGPAKPRWADVRCAETSFLVALALRGPGAVVAMIENYLDRYRLGLRQASTPANIRGWYRRSIGKLIPIKDRINSQEATYEDLSTILAEMYDVYGVGSTGTDTRTEINMLRREGYTVVNLGLRNVTQGEAAAEAKALKRGELLSCSVYVRPEGQALVGHAVHIGADPNSGKLYFYDPWPVTGDQLIDLDSGLNAIHDYFVEAPGRGGRGSVRMEFGGTEITVRRPRPTGTPPPPEGSTTPTPETPQGGTPPAPGERTASQTAGGGNPLPFKLVAKFSPPAETAEAATEPPAGR